MFRRLSTVKRKLNFSREKLQQLQELHRFQKITPHVLKKGEQVIHTMPLSESGADHVFVHPDTMANYFHLLTGDGLPDVALSQLREDADCLKGIKQYGVDDSLVTFFISKQKLQLVKANLGIDAYSDEMHASLPRKKPHGVG